MVQFKVDPNRGTLGKLTNLPKEILDVIVTELGLMRLCKYIIMIPDFILLERSLTTTSSINDFMFLIDFCTLG